MQFLVAVAEKFLVDDGQQSVLYGRACFPYFVQKHDIGCGQIAVDGTFILVGFFQSANADRTENLVGRAECSRLTELPAGRGLFQFLFRILPGSFRKGGDECVGLFPQYDLFIVSTHV